MTDFVKKAKLTELENNIPDINNLATNTALTTVENKIPDISNLVIKTDYNTKITEIENKLNNHNHDKYIDTSEFNKLAADVVNAKSAQANMIIKTNFDAKLSSLDRKITRYKTKHLLVENELNKLKTFDLSYFTSKDYFENDGMQNYLVFQPINKYLKFNPKTGLLPQWKSKGLSDKIIKPLDTSLAPTPGFKNYGKRYFTFRGGCLKEDEAKSEYDKIINISIVCDLQSNLNYNSDLL